MPLPKLSSTKEMAELFLPHLVHVNGLPKDVASDRSFQFASKFWKPFADSLVLWPACLWGFTERVNQDLEHSLQCLVATNLIRHLAWA